MEARDLEKRFHNDKNECKGPRKGLQQMYGDNKPSPPLKVKAPAPPSFKVYGALYIYMLVGVFVPLCNDFLYDT